MSLVLGLVGVLLLMLLLRGFAGANPNVLAQRFRAAGGIALMALGGFLSLTGRVGMGLPLIAFGFALLGSGGLVGIGGGRRPSGGTSRVRTGALEMRLDVDSGRMAGSVVAGRFAGRELDSLSMDELGALAGERAGDPQSAALLETYLDRRRAGGGAHGQRHTHAGAGSGRGRAPSAGPMGEEEAYQVLGLQPGAGPDEIRGAHRSLMKKIHPDQGGTTYLAARVNEAKEVLLRRHG
jgi:hypothetical protein